MSLRSRIASVFGFPDLDASLGPELSTEELDHAGMGLAVRLPGESEDDRDQRVARVLEERRSRWAKS